MTEEEAAQAEAEAGEDDGSSKDTMDEPAEVIEHKSSEALDHGLDPNKV